MPLKLQLMRLLVFLFLLVLCSCARLAPERFSHPSQLTVKAIDSLALKHYVDMFTREIAAGNEIDLAIEVTGLTEQDQSKIFTNIADKAKHNRFIGVIQPARFFQRNPEGQSIGCDIIKFHIHNKHQQISESVSDLDGVSTIQIVSIRKQDLTII